MTAYKLVLCERIAIAETQEGLQNVAVCNVQHDHIDRLGRS